MLVVCSSKDGWKEFENVSSNVDEIYYGLYSLQICENLIGW